MGQWPLCRSSLFSEGRIRGSSSKGIGIPSLSVRNFILLLLILPSLVFAHDDTHRTHGLQQLGLPLWPRGKELERERGEIDG